MNRLSALDASFLDVEDAVSHMHIGSVALFEGPALSYRELRGMVASRLPLVERYRQIAQPVAFSVGRPVWVDDAHFDLDYHLRRTALPEPGGEGELCVLVGRLMSQQLDRTRPLWEMWVVEGLADGRWALVSKTHHCLVDGVSASDLLTVILDREPIPAPEERDTWKPLRAAAGPELLLRSVAEDLTSPYQMMQSVLSAQDRVQHARDAARGLLRMSAVLAPTPTSSLNGHVGQHRRWGWSRATLSDIKRVQRTMGGTVNDVVLASVAGGFRDLLISRGESTDRVLRSLVPVSVRSPGEHGVYNNRVSAIFAELPVSVEDPVERLASIRAQMADLKSSKEAVAGEVLTSLGGFAPPMLLALAERLATRVSQHNVNTVTTNVPGPQHTLYAAGRRMIEAVGYVPLGGHVRLGVAIFSYDGALTFGVTGDYDTTPDIGVLCDGIECSLADLLALCPPQHQPRSRRPRRLAAPAA
jgi:diacylglycerol O-acyltransferase